MNAQTLKILTLVLTFVCALLITRLVLLLFAARPDNIGIASILWLSQPFAWPMSWIDATQPIYGARFERGTLIEIVGILVALYGISRHAPK